MKKKIVLRRPAPQRIAATNNNNNRERIQVYEALQGPRTVSQRGDRIKYESKYMSTEEIDQILRIQWAATHPMDRPAYEHDYYMQVI